MKLVLFKSLVLLVFLLSFVSVAHAGFFLVLPFEQKVLNGDIVELGSVSSGETFELSISDESMLESGARWELVEASLDALPTGWKANAPAGAGKRLLLRVFVPKSALPNIYTFRVAAANDSVGAKEEFTARVRVRDGLLSVAINNPGLNLFPFVSEKVVYNVVLRNDSIAPHSVKVYSSLPREWYNGFGVVVPAKQTVNVKFEVVPQVVGKKDFRIIVFSDLAQKEVSSLGSSLVVRPTLVGTLAAPSNGFPFFSASLGAFYFFDSFVFSFLK